MFPSVNQPQRRIGKKEKRRNGVAGDSDELRMNKIVSCQPNNTSISPLLPMINSSPSKIAIGLLASTPVFAILSDKYQNRRVRTETTTRRMKGGRRDGNHVYAVGQKY